VRWLLRPCLAWQHLFRPQTRHCWRRCNSRGPRSSSCYWLQAGADPDKSDAFGTTPLHAAVHNGSLAAQHMLMLAGASIWSRNAEGRHAWEAFASGARSRLPRLADLDASVEGTVPDKVALNAAATGRAALHVAGGSNTDPTPVSIAEGDPDPAADGCSPASDSRRATMAPIAPTVRSGTIALPVACMPQGAASAPTASHLAPDTRGPFAAASSRCQDFDCSALPGADVDTLSCVAVLRNLAIMRRTRLLCYWARTQRPDAADTSCQIQP
jgi:hypothetical protein